MEVLGGSYIDNLSMSVTKRSNSAAFDYQEADTKTNTTVSTQD